MKERPITFSAEMVRAIIEGRKTMTRRLVKPQPVGKSPAKVNDGFSFGRPYGFPDEFVKCPYGKPGDRLWVKESWRPKCMNCEDDDVRGGWYGVMPEYQADGAQGKWADVDSEWWEKAYAEGDYGRKWRNSRFMPRWASRILLEIVSVRVERVQDISRGDAGLEGMCFLSDINWNKVHNGLNVIQKHHWPEENFARYWDTIHAKKPESQWDANPWVWVIEFKVVPA